MKPGQRIDLYVLDFSLGTRYRVDDRVGGQGSSPEYCHIYATVTEGDRSREFTVCAGPEREKLTYSSLTSHVSIRLTDHLVKDPSVNFMVKYIGQYCNNYYC